jgi:H+/Cl- antiporter ClcA
MDSEGLFVAGMAAGIAVIVGATAERFDNYLNNRRNNPNHDRHLWGFKLSLIIVLCGVILVLSMGATFTALLTSKRQRQVEERLDFICRSMAIKET